QLMARIVAEGLAVPHFRRSPPARLDAGHVGQFMRDALVTIDTGLLSGNEKLAVDIRRAPRLFGEVHRYRGMAVAALQGIIGLQPRPFMLGEFEPMILKLLPGVYRAEDLAPDLLRGLHLAGDLVGPVVRDMAVRTTGADARAVREVR